MTQTLGQKLKERRLDRKLSLRKMSAQVGLSPQTILNIENEAGSQGGSFKNIVKLSRFLSISLDELAEHV